MAAGGRIAPLEEYELYENRMKFYLVGTDQSKAVWRVLKIYKGDSSKFKIEEDSTAYTNFSDLKKMLERKSTLFGGLRFVTKCYGVAGLFKFLGPYNMVVITERERIGTICGHDIYTVSKTQSFALEKSSKRQMIANFDENRYQEMLCSVDLSQNFFFSYSYNIMNTLQKNLSDGETGEALYESMFVWNTYLSRGLRDHLKTTRWTVALVHGFFQQEKLSVNGKDFFLTLISRRSRHFAGPRYQKRGINKNGKAANDVETEQIVFEATPEKVPTRISSVIQRRGSVPLFWSQKFSGVFVKPDIILDEVKDDYKAVKLHFADLAERYGNSLVILDLVKSHEKKPRESILHAEYLNAYNHIKKELPGEITMKFLHLDMHKEARRKNADVMKSLRVKAAEAFETIGILCFQVPPALRNQDSLKFPIIMKDHSGEWLYIDQESSEDFGDHLSSSLKLQNGLLRTNCIDSLDRTNVAQYVYGLLALVHQLSALGFKDVKIGEDDELAFDLMDLYERMGNILALQYAGSPAHNQIFSKKRGQWNLATRLKKLQTDSQRTFNSGFTDERKQNALNLFLGHFQPRPGKPPLWALDSDDYVTIRRDPSAYAEEVKSKFMKRSYSETFIDIIEEEDDVLSGIGTPASSYGGAVPKGLFKSLVNLMVDLEADSDDEGEGSIGAYDHDTTNFTFTQGENSTAFANAWESKSQKHIPVSLSDDEDEPDVVSNPDPEQDGIGSDWVIIRDHVQNALHRMTIKCAEFVSIICQLCQVPR